MKKIFFALAAVAALASCSKVDATYDDVQNEISLAPVAQNITKAMVSTTAFPESESFNVWGWYKQLPANTSIANWQLNTTPNQLYINEKTFSKKGQSWAGNPNPYYWPKLGSLLFAGYYPTSIAGKVSYEFDATTNKMIFTDIQQSVVDDLSTLHKEDIMYFNMTGVSSSAGPVAVVFRHALSWITVNVKKSEGSPKIVIDEIKFTEVDSKGTGTVNNSQDDNQIKWVTVNNNAETVFGTDVELKEADTKLVEPLFIPQTMEGELVITYTIYSSPTEFFTETYTADLDSFKEKGASTNLSTWEPAKHYIYNIEIGTSEILIDPTVQIWTDVEVPVEDLK
jgi:hypothetical protein